MNVQAPARRCGQGCFVQPLIEECAHEQVGRAAPEEPKAVPVIDVARRVDWYAPRAGAQRDPPDPGETAQRIGERGCAKQIQRIRDAAAPDQGERAPKEPERGVEYARGSYDCADLDSIAGTQTFQHQGTEKATARAIHGTQRFRLRLSGVVGGQVAVQRRRSSSASTWTVERICASECSLLIKKRSRAERSCTAGETICSPL